MPHRAKDAGFFALAGLWEHWQDVEAGKKIDSCTVITTRANEEVAELHDRMPVIIGKEDFDLWLEVNSPRNDSEEVIKRI
ncbi:MAG: SOS response-associated peptidase family protein [Desulfovermiculus sp.]|nr:SOS response-associated peptidase family protein [Desulfovermiculus sp.]